MTTYNPTQEVQKTCLEIARRVTSVKNFIEFLERENRFSDGTFVSRDYEDFQDDIKEYLSYYPNSFACGFFVLHNFPYQNQFAKLNWWLPITIFSHEEGEKTELYYVVEVPTFNTLYRASSLFEVVRKEKFDIPDWDEYENAKTGKPLSVYDIRYMMRLFNTDVPGLVDMGTIKPTPPMQGTRYHYAPNFEKLNELIELHNTLSPLVFKSPVVLEKF